MFLGVLNTVSFIFSDNPFRLQLIISSIKIDVITSFVLISNVGIKRVLLGELLSNLKKNGYTVNGNIHS